MTVNLNEGYRLANGRLVAQGCASRCTGVSRTMTCGRAVKLKTHLRLRAQLPALLDDLDALQLGLIPDEEFSIGKGEGRPVLGSASYA